MEIDAASGERITWRGQPAQGIRFTPQDVFAIPLAAVWTLGAIVVLLLGMTGAVTDFPSANFVILPLFLLFGLYILVGRFLVDRAARRRTHYYLTNRRAVIESGLPRPSRRSVSLAAVPEIRFSGGRKGRGTIHFGSPGMFAIMPPSWPGA